MRRIGCLGNRRKGRFSKLRYGMGGSAAIAVYLNPSLELIAARWAAPAQLFVKCKEVETHELYR
jgi:hypothetical protein